MNIKVAKEDSKIEQVIHQIEYIMNDNGISIIAMKNTLLFTYKGKVYKIVNIKTVNNKSSSVMIPRVFDSERLKLIE